MKKQEKIEELTSLIQALRETIYEKNAELKELQSEQDISELKTAKETVVGKCFYLPSNRVGKSLILHVINVAPYSSWSSGNKLTFHVNCLEFTEDVDLALSNEKTMVYTLEEFNKTYRWMSPEEYDQCIDDFITKYYKYKPIKE